MATPKQIAANRRNSKKSCGPKSPETKAKVAQNRTVHGLCGQFRVLEGAENQERFDAFLNQLIADEQPVGQAEIELVVKMAEHTWLSKRALRMQNNCFVPQPKTPDQIQNKEIPIGIDSQLEVYVRYHAAHDRAYQRASAEFQKRKKERRLAEIGFEREKRAQAQEERRQSKEIRTVERYKTAAGADKSKREMEELIALATQAGLTEELEAFLPDLKRKFAA